MCPNCCTGHPHKAPSRVCPCSRDDLLSKICTQRVGSFVHSCIIILNKASTGRRRRRCFYCCSGEWPGSVCAKLHGKEGRWESMACPQVGECWARGRVLLLPHWPSPRTPLPNPEAPPTPDPLILTYISHGRLYDNGVSVAEWEVSALMWLCLNSLNSSKNNTNSWMLKCSRYCIRWMHIYKV